MIEGGDRTPIVIVRTVFETGIPRCQFAKDAPGRVIVRCVIVELAGPVGHGLSQQAAERAAQQVRAAAGEEEDAEAGHGSKTTQAPPSIAEAFGSAPIHILSMAMKCWTRRHGERASAKLATA